MSHFVLVHGISHGAWCWYKLIPLLKEAGHQVTALDLGECGGHAGLRGEIETLDDHVKPLMDLMRSIDDDKKVIIVGHSFGGIAISLAMEKFPDKISVAIYVSAYMPNWSSPPITLLLETFRRTHLEEFLDTKFVYDNGLDNIATRDLELAKMLVKLDGLFGDDLAKESLFTEERFGRVKRVFVTCEEDELTKIDFQEWIINTSPPHQVKSIPKADHMAMLSTPHQLLNCLKEIIAQIFQPTKTGILLISPMISA
ncbi:Methylesterase 10 [Bienertia sinuspersici]